MIIAGRVRQWLSLSLLSPASLSDRPRAARVPLRRSHEESGPFDRRAKTPFEKPF
jgi:hypothetical protein